MTTVERPPPLHALIEFARQAAVASYDMIDPPVDSVAPFVREAASCVGCDAAALALVDSERVWFGPAFGLTTGSTPRMASVWDHALGLAGPLVVGDAWEDERFRTHDMTQGPEQMRFYAGAPLVDGDGYRLGTLCVLGRRPGTADPAALAVLSRLAAEAMRRLAVHRDEPDRRLATVAEPDRPDTPGTGPDGAARAWLGVRTKPAGSPLRPGLIVLSVAADSPAQKAALRPTDVLMSIDGEALRHPSDVTLALANRPAGGQVTVRLLRAGHVLERSLRLEPAPPLRRAGQPRG